MSRNTDAAAATKELFSQYAMDVYRYARFTLGSATEAKDIVQEVFLRVLKNGRGFAVTQTRGPGCSPSRDGV